MSGFRDRYDDCVTQMQELAQSMKNTIIQHQKNPERVCRDNSLKILIKKTQNLLAEMTDCERGMDRLTQDLIWEKTKNERQIMKCNDKIKQSYIDINYRIDEICDKQQEISESEALIFSLEETLRQGQQANENRKEELKNTNEASFVSFLGGGVFAVGAIMMPLLSIPAAAAFGLSVKNAVEFESYKAQGEVNINEVRNRLENQRRERENLEEMNAHLEDDLFNVERQIEDLQFQIDESENSIANYQKSISVLTLCKKILTEWLLFLQDLDQSLGRIESYGSNYANIKDTTAFHDYLTFIKGIQANRILSMSSNMQSLENMGESEIIVMTKGYY
uniref:Uncharacterized protein n=1 Tax=Panagrolaimus sp. PS1159 TaxID=55785 RepID=A0AC35F6M7_9BILA